MKEQKITILINGKRKTGEKKEAINLSDEVAAAAVDDFNTPSFTLGAYGHPRKKSFVHLAKILTRKRNAWHPASHRAKYKWLPQNTAKGQFVPKKLLVSISAAVITGVIFGLAVLMIFKGEGGNHSNTAAVATAPSMEAHGLSAHIGDISFSLYTLQYGVFSSEKTAEGVAVSVKEKGGASLVLPAGDGKYSVISGAGNDKQQIQQAAAYYKAKGETVYPKKQDFSFTRLYTADSMDEPFFANGKILLQNVITLSQIFYNANALSSTVQDYVQWKAHGDQQSKHWTQNMIKAAQLYENEIGTTLDELKNYTNGTQSLNWKIQQHVLDSLKAYVNLLENLEKKA